MALYLISNLYEELKCPICLDFITCAVSIACGHSFCAGCIDAFMLKTTKSRLQCPKCKKKCMKNLRPNRQLETVVRSFKLLTFHMIRNCQLRDVIKKKFHEDISLDPETANPGIILSTDKKTMKGRDSWKKVLCFLKRSNLFGTVLAFQSFVSGRHYWEVTVGNSSAWDIGLCTTSAKKIGEVSPSSFNGYWLLSLRQNKYIVCTTPTMNIPLREKLHKIGIFLDYEAGDIVFYDVDNRCHIYTFTSNFSEPLWPIFSIGLYSMNKNCLTIGPISDKTAETSEDDLDTCLETSSKGEFNP